MSRNWQGLFNNEYLYIEEVTLAPWKLTQSIDINIISCCIAQGAKVMWCATQLKGNKLAAVFRLN
jgi:hypothetical protein